MQGRFVGLALVLLVGAACTLSSLQFVHNFVASPNAVAVTFATAASASSSSVFALRPQSSPPPPRLASLNSTAPTATFTAAATATAAIAQHSAPQQSKTAQCAASSYGRPGISLHVTDPLDPSISHGTIRLILRPEWSSESATYAVAVASKDETMQSSQVYRLEPGFLIQGRMVSRGGIKPNTDKRHAPKVMERGEVGWAGGSAGPDFFIYLGTGPASWLGNPHEGAIFAEVADEASMEVANNISLVPLGQPTPPGQMHLIKTPLKVTATPWQIPEGSLDASVPSMMSSEPGGHGVPLGISKVGGAAIDKGAAECDAHCHALARTELHGGVVKWGEKNLQPDAKSCCKDCLAHAAANPKQRPCNVWVYCSSAARCEGRYQQCWLKHAADLWADQKLIVGTSDAWTSGTAEAAPVGHPSGAGRVLPKASDADVILSVGDDGLLDLRVKLRRVGAPRASQAVLAMAEMAPPREQPRRQQQQQLDRRGCPTAPPSGFDGGLLGAVATPATFGSKETPDGIQRGERWPRGAAVVRGTLGDGYYGNATAAVAKQPSAVEPNPVAVLRGSIGWAAAGGDGPHFFIALADSPHLGVAYTVWGEVAAEDMPALDQLAQRVEAPPRGEEDKWRMPMRLRVRRARATR